MNIAEQWSQLGPKCWCCGTVQLIDFGTDSWGRVWCLGCAEVADALRRPGRAAA